MQTAGPTVSPVHDYTLYGWCSDIVNDTTHNVKILWQSRTWPNIMWVMLGHIYDFTHMMKILMIVRYSLLKKSSDSIMYKSGWQSWKKCRNLAFKCRIYVLHSEGKFMLRLQFWHPDIHLLWSLVNFWADYMWEDVVWVMLAYISDTTDKEKILTAKYMTTHLMNANQVCVMMWFLRAKD